jgi:predicted phosphodiesterase
MTTIGVISDTHIRAGGKRQLPPRVFEDFKNVSLILHGGDLTSEHVLTDLETIAPVLAVYGNNDGWELTNKLPQTRRVPVEECVIGLTHGDLSAGNKPCARWSCRQSLCGGAGAVAFRARWRHLVLCFRAFASFLVRVARVAGKRVLMFNPGSPTDKRYGPHHSLGILRVDGSQISGEIITW